MTFSVSTQPINHEDVIEEVYVSPSRRERLKFVGEATVNKVDDATIILAGAKRDRKAAAWKALMEARG